MQVLKDLVATEPQAWLTPCQCSPYYQHSALYPMIDLLERVALRFEREESPPQKLSKLEGFLVQYGLPLAETVPLFAALLSLPLGADYAPLTVSPEQQKQQTLHALLAILLRIAAQQPVLFVMEDLHWVDPSTLEFLSLVVDQGPTARILALCTFRPDFSPPWTGRSHLTQVTLPRLPRRQAAEMADRVAHGKALPSEVVEQIVAKTDGVPLFVEELTKMVLESGLLQEQEERYALTDPLPPLAIPATLHDSLMARLDRLATIKGLAQLGATLGREFSYELLQAIAPWDEATLRGGLHQLVEAEFLYQQGLPPQATYVFKHALIQDAAYQSLLRSTRQQYHQRIAQVLEVRFPEIAETQPELLAHHYTEAGLAAQAVGYWQQAGQRAHARAAPAEAVVHFTQGLTLLPTLPDGSERVQQELTLQLALGPALMVTRGFAAPEVGAAYTRARLLCQQVEETPELFRVLRGLFGFYEVQAQLQTAHELAEQLLHLAQRLQEPALLVEAHRALGDDLFYLGEFAQARQHLEQGLARYEAEQHHGHALLYGQDPGLGCLNYLAVVLWLLGYPEQAQERSRQALALAHQRADPFSLSITRYQAARFHYYRREPQAVREHIEASLALAREQGFPLFEAMGTNLHGWSLTEPSQAEARLAQMHQSLAALKRTGSGLLVTHLARLAEAYGQGGQPGEGLTLVDEALAIGQRTGEQHHAAELQRLKGEILLQTGPRGCEAGDDPSPEAEACFQQALAIARQQQARSWELRAATSLARLWQSQGRGTEAYELLAPVYGWFTEGFDTADLQEAKALLNELT